MNYAWLIKTFAAKNSISKVQAKAYMDDLFEMIAIGIREDWKVSIRNFWVFEKRIVKEQNGVNPRSPSIKLIKKGFVKAVLRIGKGFKSFLNN